MGASAAASLAPTMGGARAADNMLSPSIGALVTELAASIEDVPVILERYHVSPEQFKKLLLDPTFRDALRQTAVEFAGLANVATRIKVKSQLLVEMGLGEIWNIIANPSVGPAARVAAFSQLKSLTGLEKPEVMPAPQKFKLTINLAAGAQPNLANGNNAHLIGASSSVDHADALVFEGEFPPTPTEGQDDEDAGDNYTDPTELAGMGIVPDEYLEPVGSVDPAFPLEEVPGVPAGGADPPFRAGA